MRKYGDLLSEVSIDKNFEKQLKNFVKPNSDFKAVWEQICMLESQYQSVPPYGMDNELKIDFMENIVKETLFDDSPNPYTTLCDKLIRDDKNAFKLILYPYANRISLLQSDIKMCLKYNYDFDCRQKKAGLNRSNDILELTREKEYYLPFALLENQYDDFCSYTWHSLFQDSDAIACFSVGDGKYFNAQIFPRIIKSLTYDNNECPVTNDDRWLIEKIFGVNTVLSLMPVMEKSYDDNTFKNVISPILDILLSCKPIHIRTTLAELMSDVLCEMTTASKNSPYGLNVNDLYDKNEIKNLLDELNATVSKINIIYITILNTLYDAKVKLEPLVMEIILAKDNSSCFVEADLPQLSFGNDAKIVTPVILLDITNKIETINKLLTTYQKRNYNKGDLAYRYGCIQYHAISFIYKEMEKLK
ncbi:MAG: hypothetical protein Q4F28_00745 [Eubacteriales bacterium]|nr:hypothetical protein [Eubacteriales bacterium]